MIPSECVEMPPEADLVASDVWLMSTSRYKTTVITYFATIIVAMAGWLYVLTRGVASRHAGLSARASAGSTIGDTSFSTAQN